MVAAPMTRSPAPWRGWRTCRRAFIGCMQPVMKGRRSFRVGQLEPGVSTTRDGFSSTTRKEAAGRHDGPQAMGRLGGGECHPFLPYRGGHTAVLTHSLALSVNELIKQEHSTLEWIQELAESYEIFPMA